MNNPVKPLYKIGDPASCAFELERAELIFEFSDLGKQSVATENLLVGTVEYFLKSENPGKRTRIFSLSYKSDKNPELVPYSSLSKQMQYFDFGFHVNRFLALCLSLANEAHREASSNLAAPIVAYEARARIFSRLINHMYLIGKNKQVPQLTDYAKHEMQKVIYNDGAKLIKEQRIANLKLPPSPILDFVQEIPRGSILCKEGDCANSMYVLLRGKIGVVTGGRYVAYITEPGEAFGEASLFLDGNRTASLVVEEDSAIYVVEERDLDVFYDEHRLMFDAIARTLALRISDTIDALKHFCRSLQVSESNKAYALWEQKNINAEKALAKLYAELDQMSASQDLPEIKEIWEKFVGKV